MEHHLILLMQPQPQCLGLTFSRALNKINANFQTLLIIVPVSQPSAEEAVYLVFIYVQLCITCTYFTLCASLY